MGQGHPKLGGQFSSLPAHAFPSTDKDVCLNKNTKKYHEKYRQQELTYSHGHRDNSRSVKSDVTDPNIFLPQYVPRSAEDHAFTVEETIARGAFGNVVKARRCRDNIIYAVKLMKKTKLVEEHSVKQSKEEASIQHLVGDHPFIVKPYWLFQDHENVYIVMEYIPHGELFALWKRHDCFPEAMVRIVVAEIALALDFLHQHGIVYRDLKMENILIDAQGHLQMIDFGLAKKLRIGGRTRTICGTLQYMAPEVLSSVPYSHAVDWWALGVLMFTLLVGQYPVCGATNHLEMAKKITDQGLFLLPSRYHFSWQARQCVKSLLNFDPSERICSVAAFQSLSFFEGLDFSEVFNRKVSPLDFLNQEPGHKTHVTLRGHDIPKQWLSLPTVQPYKDSQKTDYKWSKFDDVLSAPLHGGTESQSYPDNARQVLQNPHLNRSLPKPHLNRSLPKPHLNRSLDSDVAVFGAKARRNELSDVHSDHAMACDSNVLGCERNLNSSVDTAMTGSRECGNLAQSYNRLISHGNKLKPCDTRQRRSSSPQQGFLNKSYREAVLHDEGHLVDSEYYLRSGQQNNSSQSSLAHPLTGSPEHTQSPKSHNYSEHCTSSYGRYDMFSVETNKGCGTAGSSSCIDEPKGSYSWHSTPLKGHPTYIHSNTGCNRGGTSDSLHLSTVESMNSSLSSSHHELMGRPPISCPVGDDFCGYRFDGTEENGKNIIKSHGTHSPWESSV